MIGFRRMLFFAAGTIFGSAGMKILASRDAKKAYVHTAAAALRMKDSVMETVNQVQESAGDILAEAKDMNRKRAAREEKEEIIEDSFAE